jgi:hypothetical protein
MLDVMDFALEHAIVQMPDGSRFAATAAGYTDG